MTKAAIAAGTVKVRPVALFFILALTGCSFNSKPLDAGDLKNSSLVACVIEDNHGYIKDAYIITSMGDKEAVHRLFLHLLNEPVVETVAIPPGSEKATIGWYPVSIAEKNGTLLEAPSSCRPKSSN